MGYGVNNRCDPSTKVFDFVCGKYKERRSLGVRKILREEQEKGVDGKTLTKYILGNYSWQTYNQVQAKQVHLFLKLKCSLDDGPFYFKVRGIWKRPAQSWPPTAREAGGVRRHASRLVCGRHGMFQGTPHIPAHIIFPLLSNQFLGYL